MSRRFARPYAKALLASVDSDEEAAKARDELASFVEATRAVPDIMRMAANPAVPPDVKETVLKQICQQLDIGRLTESLLGLLMKNYRLIHVETVLETVTEILNRRLGLVVAEVATARPPKDDQTQHLKGVLEKVLRQQVQVNLSTDPRLLAGFVARIGSRLYDASLEGQLQRLAHSLAQEN